MRTGTHQERKWRDAYDGGAREFDILVDGEKVASQTLAKNRPGEFFDVEYAIPAKLTEGGDAVVVRLAAKPGAMAGGLFRARMMKAGP
jgi:hypothetical protein